MTSEPALPPVIGAIADDRDGTALGTVTAVFLDDVTGEPTWVGLTDGLHAAPDSADIAIVAPIVGAESSGGRLRLTVPAEAVQTAPRPAATDRLSPAEEETLRRHYSGGGTYAPGGVADTGDGSMTRSEERLRVESVREPWARAVLRVDTVTEEVMVPVTVTRQVARIEYLPLRGTEEAAGEGRAAADLADSDRSDRSTGWVTLYSDQPVVTVERAPAERVRLTTSWVTEEETVTDRLRREEIALESDLPLR
ncbi:protein of unknown function [Modestobacter sp. DSM 44400]|uniref:YsnF/AvaK domain-containing protein n=1 Tax=Modestobacter sp. DSM 44400 TaxID=1550230 RepID=UPI00089A3CC3|nr:YsnF/AvaK domain-containing protein [Modestobacter sp. DSM 44400]SDY44302.1 protein of unknown function [Modestobacter sp. DSM 44400]